METLTPFPGMSEKAITDYLWEKSIEIEPRGTDTTQRKRSVIHFFSQEQSDMEWPCKALEYFNYCLGNYLSCCCSCSIIPQYAL